MTSLADEINQELKHLEATRQGQDTYKANIKPCVISILEGDIYSGQGSLRRTQYGLYIATELRDKGMPEDKILDIITKWNYKNVRPSISKSQLNGILKQCFKTKDNSKYTYNFTCNGKYTESLIMEGHCLGLEACFYYLMVSNRRIRTYDYSRYLIAGYQHILTAREQNLLQAIIRLQNIKKQQILYTSYSELLHQTGTHKRYFKKVLQALEAYKIIDLKIGQSQIWKHEGTEIKILPIPKIPKQFIGQPKEYKKHMKG